MFRIQIYRLYVIPFLDTIIIVLFSQEDNLSLALLKKENNISEVNNRSMTVVGQWKNSKALIINKNHWSMVNLMKKIVIIWSLVLLYGQIIMAPGGRERTTVEEMSNNNNNDNLYLSIITLIYKLHWYYNVTIE